MPRTFTDWTADTVGGRLVQYASTPVDMSDYANAAAYAAFGYLPADASGLPPFPECEGEGYAGPVAPSADWVRTRTGILSRRDTIEAKRRDRAYARGFIDGSPALKADRDTRARGVPGFGTLHHDQ